VRPVPLLVNVAAARPAAAAAASECLAVFYAADDQPLACLTDPEVVGNAPAGGHWQLLGVDESRRCAYYARVAHSAGFSCADLIAPGTHNHLSHTTDPRRRAE
jgi:hypothetical protein